MPDPRLHTDLPRLSPEAYRGHAYVHWSMSIDNRATGWLDSLFHAQFREILTHASFRYGLASPIYCLMPDHLHLLWIGYLPESDQRNAVKHLRKHMNRILRPAGIKLQKQAHDHVLDELKRQREAFETIANYILLNPWRANLVPTEEAATTYPYTGCLLPGYPEITVSDPDYWDRFWRTYDHLFHP